MSRGTSSWLVLVYTSGCCEPMLSVQVIADDPRDAMREVIGDWKLDWRAIRKIEIRKFEEGRR